jgi:NDP-sugar pyrophosphorylase family protein
MLSHTSFFNLQDFTFAAIFAADEPVWSALHNLKPFLQKFTYPDYSAIFPKNGEPLPKTIVIHDNTTYTGDEVDIIFGDAPKGGLIVTKEAQPLTGASVLMAGSVFMGTEISIGKGVLIEPGAMISSPTVIDDRCVIRQGAYVRGFCLFGKQCVIGHVTEVKHSIFLNDAKAGHFAYLGDSILGTNANLGAGTKLANLKFTAGNVSIKTPEGIVDSGLRKFGAILADNVQTGCNTVTSPGTLIGPRSMVLPNTTTPSGLHDRMSIIRS